MILPEEIGCIQFLENLGPAYANKVALRMELRECPAGTVIFREGEESPFIYFLLSGQVKLAITVPENRTVDVQVVGPGELLGWSPVLGHAPMTATAQAVERCRLAALNVSDVLALCEEDPQFGMEFMRQMAIALAQRLKSTRLRLA